MTDQQLHIAIIPDGNRRWARKRRLNPWDGHKVAIENFRKLTTWCRDDPRVKIFTVWCFSTENWKRDPKEIEMLMSMLEEYLNNERKGLMENNTRFVHSGRKDRIPSSLAALIAEVEEETNNNSDNILHLAVDYGGKDEMTRAIDRLEKIKNQKPINEKLIHEFLDHPELPDIDLIIRTSGEKRTSNFFLWQAAYAEWKFVDTLFPDFTTEDLASAVDEFAKRNRRFGG